MSKNIKVSLIIAFSLILIGSIIFGGVMTVLKWDFTKLSTVKYETNEYKIVDGYKSVKIVTNTAKINFVLSKQAETSVVCFEQKKVKHSVGVKDDTLTIEVEDTRKWYDYIGISFSTPEITVCMPSGEYGNLKVESKTGDVTVPKDYLFESIDILQSTGNVSNYASAQKGIKIVTSTGKINLDNISSSSLVLTASTGNITASKVNCDENVTISIDTGNIDFKDIKCKNLISSGSTGDINLQSVIASEKFDINTSTGDIGFENSDAAEMYIETDTGDIKGSLLSDKVFITQTDTGSVNVPKSVTGGRCEITSDTGDIEITVLS